MTSIKLQEVPNQFQNYCWQIDNDNSCFDAGYSEYPKSP